MGWYIGYLRENLKSFNFQKLSETVNHFNQIAKKYKQTTALKNQCRCSERQWKYLLEYCTFSSVGGEKANLLIKGCLPLSYSKQTNKINVSAYFDFFD